MPHTQTDTHRYLHLVVCPAAGVVDDEDPDEGGTKDAADHGHHDDPRRRIARAGGLA